MAKFRKKPVVIDAFPVSVLLACAEHNWRALPECIKDAYDAGDIIFLQKSISVRTLEGVMDANYEDLIIRGVKGELCPCKPDIFAATYEAVE